MSILIIGEPSLREEMSRLFSRLRVRLEDEREPSRVAAKLKRLPAGGIVMVDDDRLRTLPEQRKKVLALLKRSGRKFVLLSSVRSVSAIWEARSRWNASDYILRPYHQREVIARTQALLHGKKRIACLGGGTGLFTLLLGIKSLPNVLVTSIVNMSDDGGSSGKLSQTFGILPPGDIRRSLVALSNAPELMNQIIQHRFAKGGELHGHSFGNIFLTVLAEVKGSMSEAVKALSDILNIQGIVLPATVSLTSLVAEFENGSVVRGESRIDRCQGRRPELRLRALRHVPPSACEPDAYTAILYADLVIIGPGDLYTSVITNLVVPDLRDAIVKSSARKVYICNLMTKPGETWGYDAPEHIRQVLRYLRGDHLDFALVSNTAVSEESKREYAKMNQTPVEIGSPLKLHRMTRARILLADVGSETELVRHDSEKLREQIRSILDKL